MRPTLMLVVVGLFCVCVCGGACGCAGSSAVGVSAKKGVGIVPTGRHAYGDYDSDEYEANRSDADNDDIGKPHDGDNDFDNPSTSSYDKDDSVVLDFGHAPRVTDARTITALIKRYYVIAAAGSGARACSMLSAGFVSSVALYLGRPPGPSYYRGKTCAQVMTRVFGKNAGQVSAYAATLRVAEIRVNHNEGIAVLAFKGLPLREIRVLNEHGKWKVDSLLDNELP